MGTLLAELASREILTGVTVRRLREYISNKYPQLSPALRAGIFADAVHRIVAGRLPELPEDRVSLFRAFLYGDAAKKQVFSIDCSDVFKSSLKLKTTDERFVKGLAVWLGDALLAPISEDKVFEYVNNACRMLDEAPDMDIGEVLETIESSVGDIRPKKRVISLIHMNPASSGAMRETQQDKAAMDSGVAQISGRAAYKGNTAVVPDGKDVGGKKHVRGEDFDREDSSSEVFDGEGPGREDYGNESAGEDWIVIRKRKSAGEVISGKIACLAAYVSVICRRTADFAARVTAKGSRFRTIAISGLIAAALLCTFLSALYVNAVGDAEQEKADDVMMAEELTAAFMDMIPAGAAAGNEAGGYEEGSGEVLRMKATAYDLSVESCGKDRNHPEYGITYSGTRAEAGRTVAVDPEVIPLGSIIRITFPEKYSYMDGIYVAEDTGRLISGNSIDIFFGEDEAGSREINKKALEFGVQYVEVEIMDNRQASR
jgi:3D (Asp-Asp-Asp) domain-containing protein